RSSDLEALAEHLAQALLPAGLGAYHAGRGAATTGRLDARRADMPDTVVGQYLGADRRGLLDADADRQARLQLLTRGEIEDLRNRIELGPGQKDRKSTRLNSSHVKISYAVFCLK